MFVSFPIKKVAPIRLVNGSSHCSGRVEVLHNQQWETVCDGSWDLHDAEVISRQLGCGTVLSAAGRARFGQGSDPIWLDEVICTGMELALSECRARPWGDYNCNHGKDAGVVGSDWIQIFILIVVVLIFIISAINLSISYKHPVPNPTNANCDATDPVPKPRNTNSNVNDSIQMLILILVGPNYIIFTIKPFISYKDLIWILILVPVGPNFIISTIDLSINYKHEYCGWIQILILIVVVLIFIICIIKPCINYRRTGGGPCHCFREPHGVAPDPAPQLECQSRAMLLLPGAAWCGP
ncbi:hypothetical protein UY3_01004 [Chelonia mydas]|uniref:SRCR domain-containing protein n=1 Tax=Chelonia mydas TaxID=8469 RepID=M7CKV7_CHEMY|nr:hypothetical protein UY3_01004 [Chelonia mydas]